MAAVVTAALSLVALSPSVTLPLGLGDPGDTTLLWAFFALTGLAIVAYARSRRGTTRAISLVATSAVAVVALVLGVASYWRCAGTAATFFTPLYWSLALFAGNESSPWGGTSGCPSAPPISIQIARLAAIMVTVSSGVGLALSLSRQQVDRITARVARGSVVVLGLQDDTSGLLRALRDRHGARTRIVVFDTQSSTKVRDTARAVRGLVLGASVDYDTLRNVLMHRGRIAAREVIVLGDQLADTVRLFDMIKSVLAHHHSLPGTIPKVIVQVDDLWAAHAWRREQIDPRASWVADAVSVYEETARFVVSHRTATEGGTLVLLGASPLALAVLNEIAQRAHEVRAMRAATPNARSTAPLPARVLLIGPGMDHTLSAFKDFRRTIGWSGQHQVSVAVHSMTEPDVPTLQELLDEVVDPVVAFVGGPDTPSTALASRFAALSPGVAVLAWSSSSAGLPERSVTGQFYPFGLSVVGADGTPPTDIWTRLTRTLHDIWGAVDPQDSLERPPPGRLPWNEGLAQFYKDSNLRQLVGIIRNSAQWRSWTAGLDGTPLTEFTDSEIAELAMAEHTSWVAYYEQNGWVEGFRLDREGKKVQDPDNHRHPQLVPWDVLEPQFRTLTEQQIRRVTDLLTQMGFSSGPRQVEEYQRMGLVTAVQRDEAWTWRYNGRTMTAAPGDWAVTGPNGSTWSVGAAQFERVYVNKEGDTFAKVGRVTARPAIPGELVHSREGEEPAGKGDWVLTDEEGASWINDDETFKRGHALLSARSPTRQVGAVGHAHPGTPA